MKFVQTLEYLEGLRKESQAAYYHYGVADYYLSLRYPDRITRD